VLLIRMGESGPETGLASRLKPPEGWSFETRTLTSPLTVDATPVQTHVLQDELTNSYSLEF